MLCIYSDGELLYLPLDTDSSVSDPKLSLEMGKAGTCEFNLPPYNDKYDSIRKLKTKITVERDNKEIFRGRVLSTGKSFDNTKAVYCEGDLAYLVDTVQKTEAFTGTTHALFYKVLDAHNAQVESDKQFKPGIVTIEDRNIVIKGSSDKTANADTGKIDYKQIYINATTTDWPTTFDYIQNNLVEYCGGYLRTRRGDDGYVYLDYLIDYGTTTTQKIEFGVNLLDLTEEDSGETPFSVLIPLGDNNLTIESVNNGSRELVDDEAVALYGRIVRTNVFDSVTNASTLLENAQRYLANRSNRPSTLTAKAVDLHFVDPSVEDIDVGDKVTIRSSPHGIANDFTCTRVDYDFTDAGQTTYTFGTPVQTLTERYRKDKQKSGGGSGGGSGEEAMEDAFDTTLQDVYAAWVKKDPKTGYLTLGGMHRVMRATAEILYSKVGINMIPKGQDPNNPDDQQDVNIYNIKRKNDENSTAVLEQNLNIQMLQRDLYGYIDISAERFTATEKAVADLQLYVSDVESKVTLVATKNATLESQYNGLAGETQTLKEFRAGMEARASNIEASVNTKAELGYVDGVATDVANIAQRVTEAESEITLKAAQNVVDGIETSLATVIAKANALESSVSMKASQTDLDTAKTSIADVTARATKLESSVSMKAEQSTVSGIQTSLAAVTATANAAKASVLTKAEVADVTGIGTRVATLEVTATNQGTAINLQADEINLRATKTYVDNLVAERISAMKGDIAWLASHDITCARLFTTSLYPNNLYVRSGGVAKVGDNILATQLWVTNQKFLTSLPSHKHMFYYTAGQASKYYYTLGAILT